jgi:hypothetical protein
VSPQIMHLAGSVSHCSCSAGRCSKLEARSSKLDLAPSRNHLEGVRLEKLVVEWSSFWRSISVLLLVSVQYNRWGAGG